MTPFSLLLQACGLSQTEAAGLHGVRLDTIKSWGAGRNRAPPGVIDDLRALYAAVETAAAHHLEQIDALITGDPDVDIEIGYPADDHEARTLGFPCVGAWRAMAAIVVASLNRPVNLVPRGSTPASAAAADAHGR